MHELKIKQVQFQNVTTTFRIENETLVITPKLPLAPKSAAQILVSFESGRLTSDKVAHEGLRIQTWEQKQGCIRGLM